LANHKKHIAMNGYWNRRLCVFLRSSALTAVVACFALPAGAQHHSGGQPSVEINMDALSGLRGPYSPPPGGEGSARPLNRGYGERNSVNAPRVEAMEEEAPKPRAKRSKVAKAPKEEGQQTVVFSSGEEPKAPKKGNALKPPPPPMMVGSAPGASASSLPAVDLPMAEMPQMPQITATSPVAPPPSVPSAPTVPQQASITPPAAPGATPLPPLDMLTQIDRKPMELPPLQDIPPALPLPAIKDGDAKNVKVTVKRDPASKDLPPPEMVMPDMLDFPADPPPPPVKEVAKVPPEPKVSPKEPPPLEEIPPLMQEPPKLADLPPVPEPVGKANATEPAVVKIDSAPQKEEDGMFSGLSKRFTNMVTKEDGPPPPSGPSKLDELSTPPALAAPVPDKGPPGLPPPELAMPGAPSELPPLTPLLAEDAPPMPATPPAPAPPAPKQEAKLGIPTPEPLPEMAPMPAAPPGEPEPKMLAPIDVDGSAPPAMPMPEIVKPESKESASLEQPETPIAAPGGPTPDMQIVYNIQETEVPLSLKEKLSGLAGKVKKDDNLRLTIVSYAAGTEQQSSTARRVSLARALAVRSFLIEQGGIDSLRINVQSMGNKNPGGPAERADIFLIKG